ncbi:RNA polymerase sigma factor [Limnoglobus roseus]|uniref:Sigma-70 family RNA polymerase sigma factor n=1 Tax=Limnoglobus roseus TaxID=2598579 RepID=A0A5C1AGW1_9BACT|nr:RNA polymerase sigma factor [Limnoglobus roseus]QEL16982.1 sigma-70 family RNA polymerase sigma factor [Limnoglobus roseus]
MNPPTPPGPLGGGGNRGEFDALYQRHSRAVWAIAFARWLDADSAMDIAQEAFLRLWREWEAGQEIQNPRAWLLRVARNLAEDYAKSAFRRNGTSPPEQFQGVRSLEISPSEKLELVERNAKVRAILEGLPTADRDILTLKYALDYETHEIADILGIQATAVHMRLSRARQRMAERFTENGDESKP